MTSPLRLPYSYHPSYKYRQSSDFWYLTGFEEPDSAVILGKWDRVQSQLSLIPPEEKTSTSKGYRMTLFCSGKNLAQEKWDGAKCVPSRFCPLPELTPKPEQDCQKPPPSSAPTTHAASITSMTTSAP